MRKRINPESHETQKVVVETRGGDRRKTSALGMVALLLVGGAIGKYLFEEKDPPARTIGVVGEVEVREWQPDMNQCFGGAPMRMTAKIKRDNKWLFDDRYTVASTIDYDICIPGMQGLGESPVEITTVHAGMPDERVEVRIYQERGALTMRRPRIMHTLCTEEEAAKENNDCYVNKGQDAGTTDLVEALPFVDDEDNLIEELEAFVQIQGSNPQCLEEAFNKIPLSTLLMSDIDSQAEIHGYDPSKVDVYLYDKKGNLTNIWDSSEQQKIFDNLVKEYESKIPGNHHIDFTIECDTSGFGIKGYDSLQDFSQSSTAP